MIKYQVITKISADTLYGDFLEFYKKDRYTKLDCYKPYKKHNPKKKYIEVELPVFHIGEILIIDDECGREICGMKRKADKWYVEYKLFDSVEEAIKCSKKLKY